MEIKKPCYCFASKTLCIIFLIALFSSNAFCGNAPKPKPTIKPHPSKFPSIKKPWTDYVIDSFFVKRDSQGNVQAKVTVKNLGGIDKGPVWVAIGINRPGAEWIEIGHGSENIWYMLINKANINETAEIKAIVDSKELINENNEDNNECSVHLAPGARRSSSPCY